MNRLRIAISALFLLASATCALAQEEELLVTPDQIEAKVNKEAQQAVDDSSQAFIDPSLSSVTRLPRLQALVSATRTDTSAALEISLNSTAAADSAFQAGLKLSGPIKKDASEANLATLEGLANQAKITFSFHWMNPRPEAKFFNKDVFIKALRAEFEAEHPGAAVPDSILMTDLSEKGQKKVLSDIGLGRGIWLIGGEGTYAAPTTFAFTIPETLEAAKERHDGYTIAASAGWLPLRQAAPYFLGLTYRREEGYQAQDPRQICRPFGVGGALECADTVLGAPGKQVKDLGQFEARVYFHGGELALNPRISRNFAKGVTGVELPVYFLKDGDGVLNGGLALGWRSDTHEVTLSAFVGSMSNPFAKAAK